ATSPKAALPSPQARGFDANVEVVPRTRRTSGIDVSAARSNWLNSLANCSAWGFRGVSREKLEDRRRKVSVGVVGDHVAGLGARRSAVFRQACHVRPPP